MNKRIVDATHEEIAQAMTNDAISKIAKKRKNNLVCEGVSEYTGEVSYFNKYTQKTAENEDLGLEFRLYKGNERRKQKIKDRITRMFDTGNALFLTLTFSDKMFARNTSTETRRRYIARFLKSQCVEYLANIDFGSTNQREHYHAVVVPKGMIDFNKYRTLFDSNINAKRLIKNSTTIKYVGMYINKLTNHALKDNGFYKRLIYSRDIKRA